MYFKRSLNDNFLPIYNRQNQNFLNFQVQSPVKGHPQKQSYPTNDKTIFSDEQSIKTLELGYLTQTYNNTVFSYSIQTNIKKKGNRCNINIEDQTINEERKKTKKSKFLQSLNMEPKILEFTATSLRTENQKGEQLDVRLIHSIYLSNIFSDSQSDQKYGERKCKFQLEQYDLESDKQNIPPSDNEQNENQSSFYSEQSEQQDEIMKIKKSSFKTLKKKYLQDIDQVDQYSKITSLGE